MEFLKNFFNDDSKVVGLCKFDLAKTTYNKVSTENFCVNPFQSERVFKTNFSENVLLM